MRVAAYQGPYLPFGSRDGVGLVREQVAACRLDGIELLCCPEAFLGGLAHESTGQDPRSVALDVANGGLASVLAPIVSATGPGLTVVVGFTERDGDRVFNSAAVVSDGSISVYRKVFPGQRTIISPGRELPVFLHGEVPFGVIICNDIWYLEPARVLAARGASIVTVPTNSGHLLSDNAAEALRPRARGLAIARAVENHTTVLVADIAGHQGGRTALGSSCIVDPDGIVLAETDPAFVGLIVADVERGRRDHGQRGWDGHTNPDVAAAFTDLWHAPEP